VPPQDQKQKQDIGLVRCGKLCRTKKPNKESMKRRKGEKLLRNIKEIKERGDSRWQQHQHI
jgi:predicted metal-binding protein